MVKEYFTHYLSIYCFRIDDTLNSSAFFRDIVIFFLEYQFRSRELSNRSLVAIDVIYIGLVVRPP